VENKKIFKAAKSPNFNLTLECFEDKFMVLSQKDHVS